MSNLTTALQRLNDLPENLSLEEMRRCCGSTRWCQSMTDQRPIVSEQALWLASDNAFSQLTTDDWLEAFSHHPKIGDLQSLKLRYAGNREWSAGEQQGASLADESTLNALAEGNAQYEQQNGFIFIVCASGKSAEQMLRLLQSRLTNSRADEIRTAAIEQQKITRLRLEKWLHSSA